MASTRAGWQLEESSAVGHGFSAMASLKPLWDSKHLAIVHAAGSPDMTRSHFDAQDYMESGTPGIKATEDGWLNRALQAEDERRRETETPFRAVALTAEMPRTLEGRVRALALNTTCGIFMLAVRGRRRMRASQTASKACTTSRVIPRCAARGARCLKWPGCCRRPIPHGIRLLPVRNIQEADLATA